MNTRFEMIRIRPTETRFRNNTRCSKPLAASERPNFPRGWWIGRLVIWSRRFGSHDFGTHMGVSKNRGTPEWMIYNGNLKSLLNWMIWGYHHFRKHPYSVFKQAIPPYFCPWKVPDPIGKDRLPVPPFFRGDFANPTTTREFPSDH